MSYYEELKKVLPTDDQPFPAYMFPVIDLVRRADKEIADLSKTNGDLNLSLEQVKDDLKTAQETNIETLIQTEAVEETTVDEDVVDNEVKTITEIMQGVEEGIYELV